MPKFEYKKHTRDELMKYGIAHYKDKVSSSSSDNAGIGLWYNRMNNGFVCGDMYKVVRMEEILGVLVMAHKYDRELL